MKLYSEEHIFQKSIVIKKLPRLKLHYYCFGRSAIRSCGAGSFSLDGSVPQISLAYSVIVRSDENFPDDAILRMHIRVHLA